jgi:hypothetical protein
MTCLSTCPSYFLPFATSHSHAVKTFDLIHFDLWTSHVLSVSSCKYYLIILDGCSYFHELFFPYP